MKITAIIAFCIAAAVILKMIERDSSEIKLLGVLFAVSAVLYFAAGYALDIIDTFAPLIDDAGIDSEYFEILLKALGIAYLTSLAEEYCRQCGEGAIAAQADLIGRLGIISVSLPLFSAAADLVNSMLS